MNLLKARTLHALLLPVFSLSPDHPSAGAFPAGKEGESRSLVVSEEEKSAGKSDEKTDNRDALSFAEALTEKSAETEKETVIAPLERCPLVGGQAVMEGILMRNGGRYAVAVRQKNGEIRVESHGWAGVTRRGLSGLPFLRGFPLLVETLFNGLKALKRSAELGGEEEESSSFQVLGTLFLAFAMAAFLFVLLPHLLSVLMERLGFGGGMEGFSFHLWDGLFKFAIFFAYLAALSFVPEIYRVFQYHGAEHKVIAALESGQAVSAQSAKPCSRLHPRCGTTFILFVLTVAVLAHAVLFPPLLHLWQPENPVLRHGGVVLCKLLLIVPVSSLAYELIRLAALKAGTLPGRLLCMPGFMFQLLTTREPDLDQLEVAVVALKEALGCDAPSSMQTAPSAVVH